jgi:nucleoside-diphosphate-sugar epimerase
MNILLIGASGFVSGTLARTAQAAGHTVWAISRGQRPLPAKINHITADRRYPEAFAQTLAATPGEWDLVVDCIGYDPADARQDLEVFSQRAGHLVFISTDFVFDPVHRRFPQPEISDHYLSDGYGGNKRLCELELLNAAPSAMAWTVVRPCHIYGPGSLLGCLPQHGRDAQLIARLQAGQPLQLAGGGHFLQQPILAQDLAELILSCAGNQHSYGEIFCSAGPDIIESRTYYQIIADLLNLELRLEELSVQAHLAERPQDAPFLCHRIYDLQKARDCGLKLPATPIAAGLRAHLESLLD